MVVDRVFVRRRLSTWTTQQRSAAMTQDARGDRVTNHLIFRFKDGWIYEDTTIFSQRGTFRLLSDHLIRRGPSFKQPTDTSIDASTGQVKVRYTKDRGGKEKGRVAQRTRWLL